ncbi:MAG: iron uptake porin [Cyanobacteria bacterium CRU_2_1]|nr:iron uptake porin [Cyanobacteria bacterium RU_5_0]NJR60409.1 iron uptake porin [Cyanobacteria bacterium CRU_2_1]
MSSNVSWWGALLAAPAATVALVFGSPAIASELGSSIDTDDTDLVSTPLAEETTVEEIFLEEIEEIEGNVTEEDSIDSAELPTVSEDEDSQTASSESTLDDVLQYSREGRRRQTENRDSLSQVTSITQLSDVRPEDWAYQALQSLVERYGCIVGYPDRTYRGQSALTRYEFAAGVNACLDRIAELLAASTENLATQEDLETLRRLQEEFAAELATLRGRVDNLEARVAELEENQFSTTTKLRGEILFFAAVPFEQDDQFNDQVIFSDRVRLNFDTSFTGEDLLRARLEAEDTPEFEGDQLGFQFGGDNGDDIQIDDLYYEFPIGDRVSALIGANGLDIDDFTDIISPLGQSSGSGGISEFNDPRQYEQGFAGSGAGAGARIQLIDDESTGLSFDFGYVANEPGNPAEGNGLFNGDYSGIVQLTFTSDLVDIGVNYVNAYDDSAFDVGVYDVEGPAVANTYGAQVNFKLFDETLEVGGGLAFTDVAGIGGRPDYDLWSWQGTLALNDLGGEGNLLGVVAGVPSYTRDLREEGETDDTGFLAELFYRFSLNDNIALTPSIIWLSDPFNDNEVDSTFIGSLRTTFRF